MVQYPVDGDRHYMKYHPDILNNAELKAAYKAETGEDIAVPKTWEDYNAIAEFMTNKHVDGKGFFFDLATMKLQINNPSFVKRTPREKTACADRGPAGLNGLAGR